MDEKSKARKTLTFYTTFLVNEINSFTCILIAFINGLACFNKSWNYFFSSGSNSDSDSDSKSGSGSGKSGSSSSSNSSDSAKSDSGSESEHEATKNETKVEDTDSQSYQSNVGKRGRPRKQDIVEIKEVNYTLLLILKSAVYNVLFFCMDILKY